MDGSWTVCSDGDDRLGFSSARSLSHPPSTTAGSSRCARTTACSRGTRRSPRGRSVTRRVRLSGSGFALVARRRRLGRRTAGAWLAAADLITWQGRRRIVDGQARPISPRQVRQRCLNAPGPQGPQGSDRAAQGLAGHSGHARRACARRGSDAPADGPSLVSGPDRRPGAVGLPVSVSGRDPDIGLSDDRCLRQPRWHRRGGTMPMPPNVRLILQAFTATANGHLGARTRSRCCQTDSGDTYCTIAAGTTRLPPLRPCWVRQGLSDHEMATMHLDVHRVT